LHMNILSENGGAIPGKCYCVTLNFNKKMMFFRLTDVGREGIIPFRLYSGIEVG
jgi:hypothetical protein